MFVLLWTQGWLTDKREAIVNKTASHVQNSLIGDQEPGHRDRNAAMATRKDKGNSQVYGFDVFHTDCWHFYTVT